MVEFIPPTPKPMEHFAGFDIFAMTSWEDPCPLVVLENMGLAKPVVCFAGGAGSGSRRRHWRDYPRLRPTGHGTGDRRPGR